MERCHELLDRHKLVLVFDLVDELYDRGIVILFQERSDMLK